MDFETENIEFKAQFTEEIYKEVIAFANTDGGIVYVGIDNEGNAVGLSDVDNEYTRITNGIRDAIMPDVTMCVKFTIQENRVVRIMVNEGTTPASPEQIRQMIKESDGDVFEEARALEQELTFDEASKAFSRYGVEFSEEKYRVLGITQKNCGTFTNLALLLSDQCPYTTKVAVFNDETCTVFRDSKEFGGSVLKQFEDTISYLKLCNKTSSEIRGVVRTDRQDYPEEAIREALLNALIHRNYSFSGSIIINVNDKRMEFISLGGLLPGLTMDDIRIGISQPRNKNLAEVFHRLRLIESYGTGIRRIYKLYEKCEVPPALEATSNAFKITLPNMNEATPPAPDESAITYQMRKVVNYIAENGRARDAELEKLLGVKHTRVYNLTHEMKDLGLLIIEGRGKDKTYLLKYRQE